MNKTFITKTLGCRVNQSESEAIEEQLRAQGLIPATGNAAADICIVNTCAVTSRACMQSRQLIRQLRRCHPKAELIVTGCYAQIAPRDLQRLNGIDRIISQQDKAAISDLVRDENGSDRKPLIEKTPPSVFQQMGPAVHGRRKRPLVKIQDGCNAFCAYCIVPYARGSSRSMPVSAALAQIAQLQQAGYREAVLTGIHLGCYGLDLNPPANLSNLLRQIRQAESIARVRLSSIEPCELTDDLISLVQRFSSGPGRICPHFHLPLQSGDDRILAQMRRPYTRNQFEARVTAIRRSIPEAAIGTDVLVGFPGETDAAFENTFSIIASLPLSYVHVFPFSARPGTPACRMSGRISPETVKSRCRRIRILGEQKRSAFYRRFVGKRLETLIERPSKTTDGSATGTSANYIPVTVKAGVDHIGRLVDVTVLSGDKTGVSGIIKP